MADLSTEYMGIQLENPLVFASSGLTNSVENVQHCEDAGAGAVVLKSMFEELIIAQSEKLERDLMKFEHPEAYDYVTGELGMRLGPKPYLEFIENVRNKVNIPVIASVNCISPKWWTSYAKDMESAGADGIELNISHFPKTADEQASDIEHRYIDIVQEVTRIISIPVAVKLGFYFTSLWNLADNIVSAGAKALVLFNRYYSIDVNIKDKTLVPSMAFSCPEDLQNPLRWTGFLSPKLNCDIAVSTGIHNSNSIIKTLMVGARVVQLCSILYKNGPEYLTELRDEVNSWLDRESFTSIAHIRSYVLNNADAPDVILKRLQYVKALEESSQYEF